MPKTKRDLLKRRTASIILHLDKSQAYLLEMADTFREHHPEYADYLEIIAYGVEQNKQWVFDFWRLAWGKLPSDWKRWTGGRV